MEAQKPTSKDLNFYKYETAGKVQVLWNGKPQPTQAIKSLQEGIDAAKKMGAIDNKAFSVQVWTGKSEAPFKYFSI